ARAVDVRGDRGCEADFASACEIARGLERERDERASDARGYGVGFPRGVGACGLDRFGQGGAARREHTGSGGGRVDALHRSSILAGGTYHSPLPSPPARRGRVFASGDYSAGVPPCDPVPPDGLFFSSVSASRTIRASAAPIGSSLR